MSSFWTDEKIIIAKHLWRRGLKEADIAEQLGGTRSLFYKLRMQHPDLFPDRKLRNGLNRTADKHKQILALHHEGLEIKQIARQLNISESNLGSYMRMHEEEFYPEEHAERAKRKSRLAFQKIRAVRGLCANPKCESKAVGKYCEPCAVSKYSKASPAPLWPNESEMRRYG